MDKDVKIEKGVPLGKYCQGVAKSVASRMEIGDSVVVPKYSAYPLCEALKGMKRKGTSKKESDTHRRVWRIE